MVWRMSSGNGSRTGSGASVAAVSLRDGSEQLAVERLNKGKQRKSSGRSCVVGVDGLEGSCRHAPGPGPLRPAPGPAVTTCRYRRPFGARGESIGEIRRRGTSAVRVRRGEINVKQRAAARENQWEIDAAARSPANGIASTRWRVAGGASERVFEQAGDGGFGCTSDCGR